MAKKEVSKSNDSKGVSDLIASNEKLVDQMGKLVKRVDHMVALFEEASKHVAEVESSEAKITALSAKLETLLDQNKNIARGLILLEKYVRGKTGFDTAQPKPLSEYGGL